MKKKMISLLLILALCLGMTISVSAGDTGGFANEYCRVQDQAELMTYSEEAELNDMLDELSVRQKMEVVVVTTNTLDGKTAEEYADDTYDYGNFGYGADKDGILLLVSVGEENICCISTCCYGITAFTDDGIEYILKEMKGDLHDEKYFAAFQTFVNLCDKFITQARSGEPFGEKSLPREPLSPIWILISLGVGVVLSLIIVGRMKAQLKTVRFQTTAGSYVKDGSLDITESRDMFLYETTSKTAKEKKSSSGGSSTHTSSSGRTHGGGGSKF